MTALHGNVKPMAGRRFGRLVVLDEPPIQANRKDGHRRWRCVCDCGRNHIANGATLRNGETNSCGCLKSERVSAGVRAWRERVKSFDTAEKEATQLAEFKVIIRRAQVTEQKPR